MTAAERPDPRGFEAPELRSAAEMHSPLCPVVTSAVQTMPCTCKTPPAAIEPFPTTEEGIREVMAERDRAVADREAAETLLVHAYEHGFNKPTIDAYDAYWHRRETTYERRA